MIYFNFTLSNPFASRWDNIFNRSWELSKYKAAEFEVYRDNTIVGFMFRWSERQSHAGMMLDIGLLGYSITLQYYDTRHWNEDEGCFYNYDKAGNAT